MYYLTGYVHFIVMSSVQFELYLNIIYYLRYIFE